MFQPIQLRVNSENDKKNTPTQQQKRVTEEGGDQPLAPTIQD